MAGARRSGLCSTKGDSRRGTTSMADALLRADAVSKSFGAVVALSGVSMEVAAGEITGLVGDNGAGKSTLIKIISGVLRADNGKIEFDGAPVDFASPAEARAR